MRAADPVVLEVLGRAVAHIAAVPPQALAAAAAKFVVRDVAKNQQLVSPNHAAATIFLVIEGWLREFYLTANGTERVKAFVLPGDFGGSLPDLLSDAPSEAFIVAGDDSKVACLPYAEFRELVETSALWMQFERAILHYVIRAKSRRERELLVLDAAGRYQALLEQRPDICDVVPQKYIALYLGITDVHLSRLRRER